MICNHSLLTGLNLSTLVGTAVAVKENCQFQLRLLTFPTPLVDTANCKDAVFAQSDAVATIYFIKQFCMSRGAATIQEQRLIKGGV